MFKLRPLIGIVNLSSNISNSDVTKMVVAIQEQLKSDVSPAWGRDYWFVMFFQNPKLLSPRAYPIVLVDNDSAPNAIGWHAEQGGKPYGKVMVEPILQNGGVPLYDSKNIQNTTVSSVLSHEVIETFIDPNVNVWVDGPSTASGSCYAMEACDPVENNLYSIKVGTTNVSVSNFVLPSYFDEQCSHEKFDFLGILSAPFTLAPSGYMVVRKAPGHENQVFGEIAPAQWRLEMKKHKFGSRGEKRKSHIKTGPANKKWWKYLI